MRMVFLPLLMLLGWVSAGFLPPKTPKNIVTAVKRRITDQNTISLSNSQAAAVRSAAAASSDQLLDHLKGIKSIEIRIAAAVEAIHLSYRRSPELIPAILTTVPESKWSELLDKAARSGDSPLAAKLFLQRADLHAVDLLALETPLREFSLDDPRAYAKFLETLSSHREFGPAVGLLRYDPYSEKRSTDYVELCLRLTEGRNDALPFEKIKYALNAADIATCRMLLERLGPAAGESAELLNLSNTAIKRIVESDPAAAGELLSRPGSNLFAPAVLQALAAAGEMEQVVASPAWRQLSAAQQQEVYLKAISSGTKMTEENRSEFAQSALQEAGSSGEARAVTKAFLEHSRTPAAALALAETAPQYRDELVTEVIRQWAALDVVAASEALAGRPAEERPDEAVAALIEEIHADPEAALAWASIIKNAEGRARQEAAVLKAWAKKNRPAATAAAARWNLSPPH